MQLVVSIRAWRRPLEWKELRRSPGSVEASWLGAKEELASELQEM
jgi:hypothetical protein